MKNETVQVGCVPITWGRWKREDPAAWPEERILREVAEAGYEGVSSGPREEQTPAEVAEHLKGFGLAPAPGYLAGAFWDPEQQPQLIERARRAAAFAAAVGLDTWFVAPQGSDYVGRSGRNRRAASGHVTPEDRLTEDEYRRMADCLNDLGRAMLSEGGVRACFHNHVGQAVETREEVELLLSLTDPGALFLGPDTGHLAWGGCDPVAFFREHAGRIKALHLKDIHEDVRAEGAAAGWGYGEYVQKGIFAELGEGAVEIPALLGVLQDAGFSGWLLAETDWTQKPSAFESAKISRDYLRGLGL